MPLPPDVQIVSIDDHVSNPPTPSRGACPAKFGDRGPKVVETEERDRRRTGQRRHRQAAGVGHRRRQIPDHRTERRRREAQGGDRPRTGALRRHASRLLRHRRADQGHGHRRRPRPAVLPLAARASPARRSSTMEDKELAAACVPAWNDFILDEWAAAYPDRQIPMSIVPYWDVDVTIAEMQAGARRRGRRRSPSSRAPHNAGLPSCHSDHWDPSSAANDAGHAAVPAFRQRRRARRRPRCQLRRRHRAVRHELAVHDDRTAALTDVPQVSKPEGRAVRGWHRMDAVDERAHRLHVGAAPPLHRLQPRRPALGPVPRAHLRLLHRRRDRRGDAAPHRHRQHHVRERLPALRQQLAVEP